MRSIDNSFYRSKKWRKCRDSFIAYRVSIDGGFCERCHNELGYIVHHKDYLDLNKVKDMDIAYGFDNLEFVCLNCHNDEHLHQGKQLKCLFDEKGKPVRIEST